MPIEHVTARTVTKPWGVAHPRPWTQPRCAGTPIGELWYERAGADRTPVSLLLKLLFTSQPLSIQVHPDDAFARLIGLPNGKTEAWYVVEAAAGAKVALGLSHSCSPQQLRRAIEDGSIADLVAWRSVAVGDVVSVPAGTIHAIGAGLVIAEIQQRSDTTFRLFDYGRQRDLHLDCAVAAANAGVMRRQSTYQVNERCWWPIGISCSNGSFCRRSPPGASKRIGRHGCSRSAVQQPSDLSRSLQVALSMRKLKQPASILVRLP